MESAMCNRRFWVVPNALFLYFHCLGWNETRRRCGGLIWRLREGWQLTWENFGLVFAVSDNYNHHHETLRKQTRLSAGDFQPCWSQFPRFGSRIYSGFSASCFSNYDQEKNTFPFDPSPDIKHLHADNWPGLRSHIWIEWSGRVVSGFQILFPIFPE